MGQPQAWNHGTMMKHFDQFFQVESVDFSSDGPTTTVQRSDLSEILSMLHETEQCIREFVAITISHCISSMCLGHNSSILLLEHIGSSVKSGALIDFDPWRPWLQRLCQPQGG